MGCFLVPPSVHPAKAKLLGPEPCYVTTVYWLGVSFCSAESKLCGFPFGEEGEGPRSD